MATMTPTPTSLAAVPVAATLQALNALAAKWAGAKAAERANAQSYLIELCDALGVERPRPAGSGYEFEFPIRVMTRDGGEAANYIDLYKENHFVLEAKDAEDGKSTDLLLRRAYGQARTYAGNVPGAVRPPYIMVLDVAKTLIVWDRWSGRFESFAAGRRIDLPTLHERPDDIALLRDVWTNPSARNPGLHSQAVTREIAAKLATLAASLEARGFAQERVAKFLMRVVFTMFAEDVQLLHDEPFRRLLDEVALEHPEEFVPAAEELWHAMDEGRRFGFRKLLRFNGHFFKDAEALPLERSELAVLLEAARADWSKVEPAIFGTLLTRALTPEERHRLGAEYTPPEFIERVVRPAVEEPLRERWAAVQAEVLQLRERGRPADRAKAEARIREFHEWLRGLRFLDPACGSGNFLYVTMRVVKRLEVDVLEELADLKGARELRLQEVDPSQFWGIEVKPWAREIAELTLWIGFHQFWRERHGVQPDEPLLRDTGTLEHRDAVLVHDGEVRDASRDRPDPTPRLPHPVTGELVPDPIARLEYRALVNPREADWPEADFIIGNPPFMGQFRQRDALGDGYVEALRAAYPNVPDAADLVMYWVYKAMKAVSSGRTLRAGLITTQSITQKQNRKVIEDAAAMGVRPVWAIGDHYWNDGSDDARVRVAMTVFAKNPPAATLIVVDGDAKVVSTYRVPQLNADLTAHADVPSAAAVSLRANAGLSSPGLKLDGAGFILDGTEAERLLGADPALGAVLRPYRNGKDLTTRPRGVYLIDFVTMNEDEARRYAVLYDIVRDRVKPERDVKPDRARREFWWRLGRPREQLREALANLPRFIATPETSKHRFFEFFDRSIAPDNSLIVVPSADAFVLGVLSSAAHITWALAAGSRLGIDGTPRYNKGPCFEAFPFPDPTCALRQQIADVAERIDRHRKDALSRSARVGMTAIYNVVDRLRAGEPLSKAERDVHTLAACGTLRDLHEELDHLVAEAYGWSWPEPPALILERLVALHDQRVEEENGGRVRWLRRDYQTARFGPGLETSIETLDLTTEAVPATTAATPPPWPANAVGQIAALRELAATAPVSVDEAVRRFSGARRDLVARHLETLAILGEVAAVGDGRYGVPLGAY
ncbi:MAG TPA: DNA methyltransferase [Gemmatimonadales bacterium]